MIQNIKYLKAEKMYGYDENNYAEWNFYFEVSGDLAKLILSDEENRFEYMQNDLESEIVKIYNDSIIYKIFYIDKDGSFIDENAEKLNTWRDTIEICADDLFESISNESDTSEYFLSKFEDIIPDYVSEYDIRDEFDSYLYSFGQVNEMTEEQGRKIIDDIIRDCTVKFTAFSAENGDIFIVGSYMSLDIFEEDFQWEDNQGFWQNQFPKNPYDHDENMKNWEIWENLKNDLLSDGELTQILTDFCHNQDYEFERDGYKLRIN